MSVKRARVLILLATCLAGLMGCSSAMKIGDFGKPNDGAASNGAVSNGDLPTGSVVVPPAELSPSGDTMAPLAKPGLLGSDPNDDVQLGKKYFRSNNFGLAEKSFRSAAENIRAMPRPGSGSRRPTTVCIGSISLTAPTKRQSASSARRRQSSTIRVFLICCAAIMHARKRSSRTLRPRTPAIPISRPICACWKTATVRVSRSSRSVQSRSGAYRSAVGR